MIVYNRERDKKEREGEKEEIMSKIIKQDYFLTTNIRNSKTRLHTIRYEVWKWH